MASDIHFTHNSISRRLAENHGGGEVRTMLSFFDALLTLVGDTLLLAMDSNDFRFHQFSSFFKNMFVAI
jgi:hypothetical protein